MSSVSVLEFDYISMSMPMVDFVFDLIGFRLLSQQRRTMEEERGRLNGLWINAHSMVSMFQNLRTSTTTMNNLKWLIKPRDVLKLPGTFL